MQISNSPAGKLNGTDYFKAFRGAGLTLLAGVIIELIEEALTMLTTCKADITSCPIDFGGNDFILPAGIAVLGLALELLRRRATNYSQ